MPFKPLSLMTGLDLYLVNLILDLYLVNLIEMQGLKVLKLASDPDQMALSLLRLGLLLPPLSYRPLLLVRRC